MSFSGDIGDVPVADTLQFIHLGGRSGTLRLFSGEAKAEIGFHRGRIVKAWGPESKRLGELLVEHGMVERSAIDEALTAQQATHPRQSLGQILVAMGVVDAATIYKVLEQQIQGTIRDLVCWSQGTFEFAMDDLRPGDGGGLEQGDGIKMNVDTQMVLLDALRLFDERNRNATQEAADASGTPAAGTPRVPATTTKPNLPRPPVTAAVDHGLPAPRLQVVSDDAKLVETLQQLLKPAEGTVVRVTLREAGIPPPGEPPPFLVLDLRKAGGVQLEALKAIRRSRPRSSVIALIESGAPVGGFYEAGAMATVDSDVLAIASCFRSAVQNRVDLLTGGIRPERMKENFAKLRRIVGDLRSGLISTTISLSLMNIISESVERAVLFLVQRSELAVLGAFGAGDSGQPLALLTRGLRLPVQRGNALVDSIGDAQVRSMPFDDARLPDAFRTLLGKPRSGQCAILPVLGGQKVIAVVYADNGFSNIAIEQVEMLELAAVQAGLALENELLRRQLGQARPESRSANG